MCVCCTGIQASTDNEGILVTLSGPAGRPVVRALGAVPTSLPPNQPQSLIPALLPSSNQSTASISRPSLPLPVNHSPALNPEARETDPLLGQRSGRGPG